MILDIWQSFRRIPGWVQIWVMFILVPVNLLPLLFLNAPFGVAVALLAVGGMLPNLVIMWNERGLSKRMALPHLVLWTPLVILVAWVLWQGAATGGWAMVLWALLVIDLISLGFDYVDAVTSRATLRQQFTGRGNSPRARMWPG